MTTTPSSYAKFDLSPLPNEPRPLYRVAGDPETGLWTSEPELIGERRASDRPDDVEGTHYDSFEREDGVSCEVDVIWNDFEAFKQKFGL